MKKVLSVIKREYIQIVRTKGFIIATILGPVLIASFIVVPILVSVISVGQQERIGVVDLSQGLFETLDKKLDYKLKDGRRRYLFQKFQISPNYQKWRQELNQKVLNKELSAYIYIPADILEEGRAEYISQHVSDFDKLKDIHQALNSIIIEKRLRKEGLDPKKIAGYIKGVELKTIKVTKKGEEEERHLYYFLSAGYYPLHDSFFLWGNPLHDSFFLWGSHYEGGYRREKLKGGGDCPLFLETFPAHGRKNFRNWSRGLYSICYLGSFRLFSFPLQPVLNIFFPSLCFWF